jgi:hypothetical protein
VTKKTPPHIVTIHPTLLPDPEPFPLPTLGSFGCDAYITVFTLEQAHSIGAHMSDPVIFLCIDIPRARWCRTVADAVQFFNEKAP